MFFKKKGIIESGIFKNITDFHSHILPGVDDGVRTLTEACNTLSYFEKLGVKQVVLTPHIMEDYPLNNPINLKIKFNTLCETYSGPIKLSLGAEYMLDGAFEQQLNLGELIPIFDDHILIETSYINAPINFLNSIKQIQSKGYHVVLAHPERYMYMGSDLYKNLKNNGVSFQLNILSMAGAYGTHAQKKSKKLLQNDYYDCIGSDIHHLNYFRNEIERMHLLSSELRRLNALKEKRI